MSSNKEKILVAALKLFNQDGIVNVRLQHIADEAFVSVGNLAYHYPNKEAILKALYDNLTTQQQDLLTQYRVVPLFENIDRLIRHTFILQQAYIFFYLDTLEILRSYPSIGALHRQHIQSQINQLKVILDFNRSRGALDKERLQGAIDSLAVQIWMTMDMYLFQQAVRTNQPLTEAAFQQAVWNLLLPYCTLLGEQEHQQMLENPYEFYF